MKITFGSGVDLLDYLDNLGDPLFKITNPVGLVVWIGRSPNNQEAWKLFAGSTSGSLYLMAKGWRLYQLEDTE